MIMWRGKWQALTLSSSNACMPWLIIEDDATGERHVVPGTENEIAPGHVLNTECTCGVHRDYDDPTVIIHEQIQ